MLVNEVQFGLLFIFRVEPDDFQFILAFSSEKWTRRRPLLLLRSLGWIVLSIYHLGTMKTFRSPKESLQGRQHRVKVRPRSSSTAMKKGTKVIRKVLGLKHLNPKKILILSATIFIKIKVYLKFPKKLALASTSCESSASQLLHSNEEGN